MIYTKVTHSAHVWIRVCAQCAIAGVLLCASRPAYALESASYLLYDSFPNYDTGAPDVSTSYILNENGITWYPSPSISTNYLFVTAPPTESSSSASSIQSSVASASTQTTRPSGGRRGNHQPPVYHPSADKRSSSSASSRPAVASPLSWSSSSSSDQSAPFPVAVEAKVSLPDLYATSLHPAARCTGTQCWVVRPWMGDGRCLFCTPTAWPLFGMICAVLEALLLLRILRRSHSPRRPR